MKLKTKFQDEDFGLGEVVDGVIFECLGKHEEELRVIATAAKGGQHTFYYSSIKKFMDDWEDAPEEPKGIVKIEKSVVPTCVYIECTTEEEAEKAVEKLKAWKRLKEAGFRFTAWKNGILLDETVAGQVRYEFPIDNKVDIEKDLDLLFSGGGE